MEFSMECDINGSDAYTLTNVVKMIKAFGMGGNRSVKLYDLNVELDGRHTARFFRNDRLIHTMDLQGHTHGTNCIRIAKMARELS